MPFIKLDKAKKATNALEMPKELSIERGARAGESKSPSGALSGETLEEKAITKMMQVSPCKDRIVYSPCQGKEMPRTYNEFCWRGPSFSPEKPAGTYRIIAVGGSTCEGFYTGDEDLWTVRLERLLNENNDFGVKFELINAGSHDFYSRIIRKLLEEKAFFFQPDMILYYESINEQQVSHPLTKMYGRIARLETSIFGRIHNLLFFRSFLYTYLLEKYHFIIHKKEYRWAFHEDQTREDFTYIIDACRERGIEFVLIKQVIYYPLQSGGKDLTSVETLRPLLEELYGRKTLDPAVWNEIHALNQRLVVYLETEICKSKGAPVIDPLAAFDQARHGPDKLFMDICHLTCYGEKLLAECTAEGLKNILSERVFQHKAAEKQLADKNHKNALALKLQSNH
jgi:hypothetical protein